MAGREFTTKFGADTSSFAEGIAAIDAEIEARKRLNEDEETQNELDAINAQLEYEQLDELSRRELERKRQDLLDEQAETEWECSV